MSNNRRSYFPARCRERGAAAVEFALVAPILLMFVLGIIDFGRLYFTQVSLTQAAREGARLEALGSSNVVTGATGSATGLSGLTVYINGGPTGYTSNPSPAIACTPGADATVKVESTNFTFTLAGLLGIGPKTIVGYGVMPCGG